MTPETAAARLVALERTLDVMTAGGKMPRVCWAVVAEITALRATEALTPKEPA